MQSRSLFYKALLGSLALVLLAACAQGASAVAETSLAVTASAPPGPSPTPSSRPNPEPGDATLATVRISEIDQMEQGYIEAGEFIMGSEDPDAKQAQEGGVAYPEAPLHTLYLPGYWIDKYEVTNGQYKLCVDADVCEAPFLPKTFMGVEYFANPDYAHYPVIYVDWYMARDYCEWADRRLPTEAEWEKAARGTDGRKFPWGNDPVTGERANFCDGNCPKLHANPAFDDGYSETAPVGSYPAGASPNGIMDMSGNVWEWTSTIPQPYPYDAEDGREAKDLRVGAEVREAYIGPQRVWRGGTWANGVWWMRASVRYHSVPWYWHNSLGFRCAASE